MWWGVVGGKEEREWREMRRGCGGGGGDEVEVLGVERGACSTKDGWAERGIEVSRLVFEMLELRLSCLDCS